MTTSPEGITLLGSEMLTWSDAQGEVGAFGGLVAPHLLHAFRGTRGRVLVAGPTAADVIRDVAAQFDGADVLVRSWLDAQDLRAELPQSVGVVCGPLDRLPAPGGGYDAVVAVAGLDRLHSAEEETPTWERVVAELTRVLSPTGELYLAVGNPAGIDRLLSLSSDARHHDADWPDGHLVSSTAAGIDDVADHLESEHGLSRVETWVCHGRRSDPLVAASASTFVARRHDPVLLRMVGRAYDVPDASAPALKDPGATARELVRAGLGAATAPLSVLHVRRGAGGAEAPVDVVLVQEPVIEEAPPVAFRMVREGDGWVRSVLGTPQSYTVAPGLTRDTALLSGPVPTGESLAAELAECCAQHDVSTAGALVRRLRDWLGDGASADVAAGKVPLTPRRLVVADGSLAAADLSFSATQASTRDVVLVRDLLDFAADLLARGGRHPWSAAASPRELATSLAAAAGVEVADSLYADAVALDARLRPGQAPEFEAPGGGRQPRSYAELAELAEELAQRAADGDAHVLWLLRRLQTRQRTIRKTRGMLRAVNESREYRVGRKIFWIRELRRRREQQREAAARALDGEWRDRSSDDPEYDPDEVESDLLPPGYTPPEEIRLVPPLGDGS